MRNCVRQAANHYRETIEGFIGANPQELRDFAKQVSNAAAIFASNADEQEKLVRWVLQLESAQPQAIQRNANLPTSGGEISP